VVVLSLNLDLGLLQIFNILLGRGGELGVSWLWQ